MEVGHELDELVATKVMGELRPDQVPPDALEKMLAFTPYKSDNGNWVCLADYENADVSVWEAIHFSADITAAWKVVEQLRNSKKYCCLKLSSDHNYVWDVTWTFANDEKHSVHSIGYSVETAPHAICLAALEAVGMETL